MLAKKTVSLLSSFSKAEQKSFLRWMNSPVHNTDVGLANLAHYLLNLAPASAPEKMEPHALWAVLYADKSLKEGVLRVKIRQLTRQVEDFIAWKELQGNPDLRNRLILRARRKDLPYRSFEHDVNKLLRAQERTGLTGPEYYADQLALRGELKVHPGFDQDANSGKHLYQMDQDLDAYFTLSKYRLRVEFHNRRQVLGDDYEPRFLEAINTARVQGALPDARIMSMYHLLLELLERTGDLGLINSLRLEFAGSYEELPKQDQHSIFYTVVNQLSRLINQGKQIYLEETVHWYSLGLEAGIVIPNGVISPVAFSNIVLIGFRAGKFEWTDEFIKTYSGYLREEERTSVVHANQGVGAFYRGEYEEAYTTLKGLEVGRVLGLRVRLTLVRSMYELYSVEVIEYEAFERALANFESWLQRSTAFSEQGLKPYRNHLRLLRKVARLKAVKQYDVDRQERLQAEIVREQALIAKEWLIKKVEGTKSK